MARELIERDGPDGFSVAEAARKAGVSSAAPYKHFKDRADLVHAIVSDAMDRLGQHMSMGAARHPRGSLQSVTEMGMAYTGFARREPGVFRVMFGLTDGQNDDDVLMVKGSATYDILRQEVADFFGTEMGDPRVERASYLLWTVVHGHSFLTIDSKLEKMDIKLDEWTFLLEAGRRILVDLADPDALSPQPRS